MWQRNTQENLPRPFLHPAFRTRGVSRAASAGCPRDAAHAASLWHTEPLQLLVCPQDDLCDCTFWAFLLPLPGSKLSWSAAAPGHPIWKNQCVLFREQAPRHPLSPQPAQGAGPGRVSRSLPLFLPLLDFLISYPYESVRRAVSESIFSGRGFTFLI